MATLISSITTQDLFKGSYDLVNLFTAPFLSSSVELRRYTNHRLIIISWSATPLLVTFIGGAFYDYFDRQRLWSLLYSVEPLIITLITFDDSYPKLDFYHTDGIRTMMVDILFVYAKLKPDVSYRQVSRSRESDGAYDLCFPVVLRNALPLILVSNPTSRVFQHVSVLQLCLCQTEIQFQRASIAWFLFLICSNAYFRTFPCLILI